jgi:AMP nucleosidase
LIHDCFAGQNWDTIANIFTKIVQCVDIMHRKGVIHGDLKPLNVVSKDMNMRLIDFDSSVDLKKGDFILPTAAIRDEGVSHHFLPRQAPALPTFKVQKFVSEMLVEKGLDYRTGVVHTTDYRFWEFNNKFKAELHHERALAIDMETATLFVVGFASKVPIGALLLVSDLPLKRGGIKTKRSASTVFKQFTDLHLELGIKSMSEIAERGEHIRHYKW